MQCRHFLTEHYREEVDISLVSRGFYPIPQPNKVLQHLVLEKDTTSNKDRTARTHPCLTWKTKCLSEAVVKKTNSWEIDLRTGSQDFPCTHWSSRMRSKCALKYPAKRDVLPVCFRDTTDSPRRLAPRNRNGVLGTTNQIVRETDRESMHNIRSACDLVSSGKESGQDG